ncbi:oligoribonuclease [Cytobacillus praedii]|uniref:oligoribonuclease n=1 Tax=Cytobacillus praedii TaxID=1742358 RepID=UPI002E1F474C|nr:oligoribonuclease [Cytobacillus praedii]
MTAANKKKESPTVYTKAELIAAASVFEVKPEIVAGALYDKKEATKEEAAKLIKDYLKKPKEVK